MYNIYNKNLFWKYFGSQVILNLRERERESARKKTIIARLAKVISAAQKICTSRVPTGKLKNVIHGLLKMGIFWFRIENPPTFFYHFKSNVQL